MGQYICWFDKTTPSVVKCAAFKREDINSEREKV